MLRNLSKFSLFSQNSNVLEKWIFEIFLGLFTINNPEPGNFQNWTRTQNFGNPGTQSSTQDPARNPDFRNSQPGPSPEPGIPRVPGLGRPSENPARSPSLFTDPFWKRSRWILIKIFKIRVILFVCFITCLAEYSRAYL